MENMASRINNQANNIINQPRELMQNQQSGNHQNNDIQNPQNQQNPNNIQEIQHQRNKNKEKGNENVLRISIKKNHRQIYGFMLKFKDINFQIYICIF
jgi:hypothetical protein